MKNKILYVIVALTSSVLFSCTNLDTEPHGATATSSQKENIYSLNSAKIGVNAIYSLFSQYQPNSSIIGKKDNDFGYPSIMLFTDLNGTDMVCADVGYSWASHNLDYTDRNYTSYNCQIVWNDLYSMIYATNNLIGAISLKTTDPQNQFNLAQGFGIRAFDYFILAQLYQFNYKGHENDPCVPIITNENSETAAIDGAPRATVQKVYDLILSDLGNAITLLTSSENEGIARSDKRYINLAVAYGIRARVNLAMQNWADAASDAENAISHSNASPASRTEVSVPYFWSADENDWMWGIIIAETDDVVKSGIVNWISHVGSLNDGYAKSSGGNQINKALYNSIPSTDVRKGWWTGADSLSNNLTKVQQDWMFEYEYPPYTEVKFAPYNNMLGTLINANDIPLMRIEEMYLIDAEALTMSGGNGLTVLNSFVKTYRDPSYNFSSTSKEAIQQEVWRQRRIELWGEGLSWYDIMRLNKGVDRRGGGYPDETSIFNIPAGSNILLWRIPKTEINSNKGISETDNNPVEAEPDPVADN